MVNNVIINIMPTVNIATVSLGFIHILDISWHSNNVFSTHV